MLVIVGYVITKVIQSFDFRFEFNFFDCVGDEWFVFLDPLLNYFSWFYEEVGKGGFEDEMFVTW